MLALLGHALAAGARCQVQPLGPRGGLSQHAFDESEFGVAVGAKMIVIGQPGHDTPVADFIDDNGTVDIDDLVVVDLNFD